MRKLGILFGALVAAATSVVAAPSGRAVPGPVGPPDGGCRLILEGAPAGTPPCPGVRPGGLVTSDIGGCSFNFLFHGSDGERYMGTAGHCYYPDTTGGEDVLAEGEGLEARVEGKRVGEFAYTVLTGELDFALIRLDDEVEASPAMCHFGGPTSIYTEHSPKRLELRHYGNGVGLGNTHLETLAKVPGGNVKTLPARSGHAWQTLDDESVYAMIAVTFGDSGSGVIDDRGRAVGVAVQLNVTDEYGNPAPTRLTRLDLHLARAEEKMGIDLTLQTAPLETLAVPHV